MSDIQIQPYSSEYQDQCLKLVTDIQKQELKLDFLDTTHQDELTNINSYYNDRRSGFWIALQNRTVIGTIGVKAIDDVGILKKMYVQKEYRGNGLALQLIQTVKERARQHGLTYLCLGTNSSMEKTKRYYEKNGWTPIDRHSLPSNVLAAFNIADDAFFKLTLECIPQVP